MSDAPRKVMIAIDYRSRTADPARAQALVRLDPQAQYRVALTASHETGLTHGEMIGVLLAAVHSAGQMYGVPQSDLLDALKAMGQDEGQARNRASVVGGLH